MTPLLMGWDELLSIFGELRLVKSFGIVDCTGT